MVPCNELSGGGRLKVMVYLVEKAAGAFVREKGVSQKLFLEKLKGLYQEDDVVMGFSFYQGFTESGGEEEEWVSLVEEARKMKI